MGQNKPATSAHTDVFTQPRLDTPPQQVERRTRMALRLRELQVQSGLSVRQLAKRATLSRQTVMTALKSGLKTSPRTYEKLFAVLETTPKLERALLEPRFSQEDLEITMAYHDAPTPQRNFVAKILRTREFSNPELPPRIQILAHEMKRLELRDLDFVEMIVQHALAGPPHTEPPKDE